MIVQNTQVALQKWAAHHRGRFEVPMIGITGSNGKTIVKEWLATVMDRHFSIVKSPKSYNSQIGVPISVLQISDQSELALIEAGISVPGEMEKLEKVIQPDYGTTYCIGQ